MSEVRPLRSELVMFLRSQMYSYPFGIPKELSQAARTAACSRPNFVPKSIERLAFRLKVPLSKLVFGSGAKNPLVMFIRYELQGDSKALELNNFSGAGGELLQTAILKGLKLNAQQVFVTSFFKGMELFAANQGAERILEAGNTETFKAAILEEIEVISPKFLVLLGERVAKIFGFDQSVKWGELAQVPTIISLDPNDVAKDESLKRPFWEDLKSVVKKVN